MKKTLIFCLHLMLALNVMSQQLNQQQLLTKNDYLEKSKANRTGGFIMLGAGVALGVGGFITLGTTDWLDGDNTPFILMSAGIGSMLGSIPLFIIAANQSKKAASVSGGIKLEVLPKETYGTLKNKSFPSVSVVMKF